MVLSLWMKFFSVTIQMKATEQYFPVVLFIILYKVVLTFLSLWMKSLNVTIQMKATEQYFPVVLFIMLHKVVLTCKSVEILKCDHSNKGYYYFLFLFYPRFNNLFLLCSLILTLRAKGLGIKVNNY